MTIAIPTHWKEPFLDQGPKYDKIVEMINQLNATDLDIVAHTFKSTTALTTTISDGIFSYIPSAAWGSGNDAVAYYCNFAAADPVATGTTLIGFKADMSGVDQTYSPTLYGVDALMPSTYTGEVIAGRFRGAGFAAELCKFGGHILSPMEFFHGDKNIGDDVATAVCRVVLQTTNGTGVHIRFRVFVNSSVDIGYANAIGEWITGFRSYGGDHTVGNVQTVQRIDLGSANAGFANVDLPIFTVGGSGATFDITIQCNHSGASGGTVNCWWQLEIMEMYTGGTSRYTVTAL